MLLSLSQIMSTTDLDPINTDLTLDDADFLSDISELDNMENEDQQVSGGPSPNGKWEFLTTRENTKKDGKESPSKEKTFEQRLTDRMNAALDASINADKALKSPSRNRQNAGARRQNATLEDFMSPRRKTRPNQSKRNRSQDVICSSPIVSPPHKSHRVQFAHKYDSTSKTTR